MAKPTIQAHIDAAGRLACIINDLSDDTIHQLDVLEWCQQTNTVLANDTHIPGQALALVYDDHNRDKATT